MTTTIDFDALQASEGSKVPLLGNRNVGGGLVGDDFADFSSFASLSVDVKVQRMSSTSPPPLLTVLVEHSDDGLSWSTAETFTFTDDGEQTASLASPKAHVRASASGSGAEWYVKSVNVAPIAGGGGSTPFNGGTITDTLEIDAPAATNGLIVKVNGRQMLKAGSDGSVVIQAEPGHNAGRLSLRADDTTLLEGAGNAFILIAADDSISFGAGETIEITAEGSLAIETLQEEPQTTVVGSMIPWYDSKSLVEPSMKLIGQDHRDDSVVRGGGLRLLPAAGYHFAIADHAAPADGELVAGDMCVWFDQTNGAAKLMVKAKTADGTVVTGSLALAP